MSSKPLIRNGKELGESKAYNGLFRFYMTLQNIGTESALSNR